jgi:hypothetical protein
MMPTTSTNPGGIPQHALFGAGGSKALSHLGVYRSAARDFRNATAQRGHILDS